MGYNIIFAGTPDFAVPTLQALLASTHTVSAVYTQPDRPAGRGRHLTASPVKTLALAAGLPVCQPSTLRDPQVQAELGAWHADLMIVVAYGQILPLQVLQTPSLGCLNVHASLLPRWRGAAPIQRAMLAGDPQTGVTIMQMDAGLDTGAMLWREACPILPDETGQSLHDRLAVLGAQALIHTLTALAAGELRPEVQDNTQANYASKLSKLDGKIDWTQPAQQIERQVRALNPWPIAFTHCGEQALRLWQAQALPQQSTAVPGTILTLTSEGIEVATGDGVLRILRLQEAGGKPLACSAFVNSPRQGLVVGAVFS